MGLTVAVTGPTGEIGLSAIAALEAHPEVERINGMARRPFDPAAIGWRKTHYRQGDILDRAAVDALVTDADVVVHLAYLIMGSREESRRINLEGTRNVFEATVAADRPTRLVYTSSVAAYGYHRDNPTPLTEDVETRGSAEHYYSQQKAECEALLHEVTDAADLEVYVLRPCIVAGPKAPALANSMPWQQVLELLPAALRPAAAGVQGVLQLMPSSCVHRLKPPAGSPANTRPFVVLSEAQSEQCVPLAEPVNPHVGWSASATVAQSSLVGVELSGVVTVTM